MLTVLLASFALAVPELPRSPFADTEASTNVAITVEADATSRMTFVVSMVPSPSNNVEVAVGTDADGDGNLAVDEADWTFGWDCGRWFVRKMENGECGECKVENGKCKTDDALSTFHSPFSIAERTFVLPSRKLDARWNLAKVTRRGLGASAEGVMVKCRHHGMVFSVR